VAFMTLAGIAMFAFAVAVLSMPETRTVTEDTD